MWTQLFAFPENVPYPKFNDIDIDERIALSYYFIACGIKAHRKFISSPVDELPGMQKTIYDELPQSFETRTGLLVAERYGMPERTFKRWLSTSLFRKITHGYYEKRYR